MSRQERLRHGQQRLLSARRAEAPRRGGEQCLPGEPAEILAERWYAVFAAVKAQWQPYHGKQSGDPAKLGKALVQLAAMESPPKHKDLSVTTDGAFEAR